MSLHRFFNHKHPNPLPIRMYEFEFEYLSGRGVHEATLAYVVATNINRALLELKSEITKHHCQLKQDSLKSTTIERERFDTYVHSKWPEYAKTLVSKDMIKNHEHTVYVLPPIELID